MKRSDFQKLAEVRIKEAEFLLKGKKYDGAYYLAGYAVECALKACIAKKTGKYDYPDKQFAQRCYTHNVEELAILAGLHDALKMDPDLMLNWVLVKDWTELARYERKTRTEAQELYHAITDPNHGVLPWIESHW